MRKREFALWFLSFIAVAGTVGGFFFYKPLIAIGIPVWGAIVIFERKLWRWCYGSKS